jgi:hypothetical protein
MMWCMTLADLGTLIAYLSTELADRIELRRVPADPTGAEHTNVTTVAAKACTLCHEFVTMMLCHADHVICAGLTGLSAGETGIDAVSLLLRQWVGLHDSISFIKLSMTRLHKQGPGQCCFGLLMDQSVYVVCQIFQFAAESEKN